MGQALYRKYRSKNLAELVGQEHITTALANALRQDRISHAYLLTGPRGTGKTSVARILAHEVNRLPYEEGQTHLDIIEIDAASNRRIDEIRELRERVHNAPAQAKYKVYIIDEVHMLTREAFNALLKTLEEPPAHAIFILATTEAHKLPETIISRTQRFTFRPVEPAKVIEHLRHIANREKIKIDDQALGLIAEHGEGSFRDSISLLDQLRHNSGKVTLDVVQRNLGIAPSQVVEDLIDVISTGDIKTLVGHLTAIREGGFQAPQLARQLGETLRQQLVTAQPPLGRQRIGSLLRQLVDVPAASDPDRLLEIILLETALASQPDGQPGTAAVPPLKAAVKQPPKPAEPATPAEPPIAPKIEAPPKPGPAAKKPKAKAGKALDDNSWQEVLQAIKAQHNTLYSVARMALPRFDGTELILTFSFPFHQKRLNESRNRKVISDIINDVTGQTVTITCLVDINARQVPAAIAQPQDESPDIANISNIFGGGEVLE